MDSGNTSGSISSSAGDEELESRSDSFQTFLIPSDHFGTSFSSNPQSSLFHHQPTPNLFPSFSPQTSNVNPSLPTQLGVTRSGRVSSSPGYTIGLGTAPASQTLVPSGSAKPSSSSQSDHRVVTRNPKKRTRASRRAPTTVLTTDTTNFRAMVQEFTGIPSPPFTGTSMYSKRFDLFGSGSNLGSLFRPSAEKIHQQIQTPFLASNIAQSISKNNSSSSFVDQSSMNYQQEQQTQTLLNMQHQFLPFQPLFQPSFGELGMSHSHVNVSLGGLNDAGLTGPGFDGNFSSSQRLTNGGSSSTCKLNYTTVGGGSSEFQLSDDRAAGSDNVPSRGEGSTVDSWICHEINNEAK